MVWYGGISSREQLTLPSPDHAFARDFFDAPSPGPYRLARSGQIKCCPTSANAPAQ